jgi:CheY-like chemotaxis protein
VEDNDVNNKLLCNILKAKYTTRSAVNGEQAVSRSGAEQFDAILMDIQARVSASPHQEMGYFLIFPSGFCARRCR